MTDVFDEYSLWRDPAPLPYRWEGRTLAVPSRLIEAVHTLLQPYADRGVESCCFLYGTSDVTEDRALAIATPAQENRRGSFDVTAEAIATMSAATRPRRWLNLAQIHTHPGSDVEHSRYDDAHVNSRRALSLVLPAYGRMVAWTDAIGVHEYQSDYWHLLDQETARKRVVVTDGSFDVLDLR